MDYIMLSGSNSYGIAVDQYLNRIFYTDYGKDYVVKMDYDGNNQEIILTNAHNLINPRGIITDTVNR